MHRPHLKSGKAQLLGMEEAQVIPLCRHMVEDIYPRTSQPIIYCLKQRVTVILMFTELGAKSQLYRTKPK